MRPSAPFAGLYEIETAKWQKEHDTYERLGALQAELDLALEPHTQPDGQKQENLDNIKRSGCWRQWGSSAMNEQDIECGIDRENEMGDGARSKETMKPGMNFDARELECSRPLKKFRIRRSDRIFYNTYDGFQLMSLTLE